MNWTKRRDELAKQYQLPMAGMPNEGMFEHAFKAGYNQARKDMLEELGEFDVAPLARASYEKKIEQSCHTYQDFVAWSANWQFEQIKKKLGAE